MYDPQVGCEVEEKEEEFWSKLDKVVERFPRNERLVKEQISMDLLVKGTEVTRIFHKQILHRNIGKRVLVAQICFL